MLNIDGWSKGNPGPARIAGLFRDSEANWADSFAINMGITTAISAELRALWSRLVDVRRRGLSELRIDTNSEIIYGQVGNVTMSGKAHWCENAGEYCWEYSYALSTI